MSELSRLFNTIEELDKLVEDMRNKYSGKLYNKSDLDSSIGKISQLNREIDKLAKSLVPRLDSIY